MSKIVRYLEENYPEFSFEISEKFSEHGITINLSNRVTDISKNGMIYPPTSLTEYITSRTYNRDLLRRKVPIVIREYFNGDLFSNKTNIFLKNIRRRFKGVVIHFVDSQRDLPNTDYISYKNIAEIQSKSLKRYSSNGKKGVIVERFPVNPRKYDYTKINTFWISGKMIYISPKPCIGIRKKIRNLGMYILSNIRQYYDIQYHPYLRMSFSVYRKKETEGGCLGGDEGSYDSSKVFLYDISMSFKDISGFLINNQRNLSFISESIYSIVYEIQNGLSIKDEFYYNYEGDWDDEKGE